MIGQDMVNRLYDAQVVDPTGEKIGSVKRVWLDGQTGDPLWASVHTGLFGLKESFVPLQRAELRNDQIQVPVDKEQVKESPKIEAAGDHMSDDEQAALYQHYGLGQQGQQGRQNQQGAATTTAQQRGGIQQQAAPNQQQQRRPGSSQQSGDYPNRGQHSRPERENPQEKQDRGMMTRSEEQLKVGTERVESGRVRLVKHVVTEEQQVTVPVSHEEVRIEREPITDANRVRGAKIGEDAQEMILHAEKPVVQKETVAMEQVRLGKETVTEQETVSGTVRKEQIEVEDGRRTNGDGRGKR